MSKKSFKDIEQIIRNAAEANIPAFDETAWAKMEALLDKEEDRRRPFFFWFWWLLPLLIGAALIGRYALNNNNNNEQPVSSNVPSADSSGKRLQENESTVGKSGIYEKSQIENSNNGQHVLKETDNSVTEKLVGVLPKTKNSRSRLLSAVVGSVSESDDELYKRNKGSGNSAGKALVNITPALPEAENNKESETNSNQSRKLGNDIPTKETDEVVVVKIETGKEDQKKVEKILEKIADSLIKKTTIDKKGGNRISKFFIIVAAGAEASGVKVMAADKITIRSGLSVGYQISKKFSVQAGFYLSNKKYKAGPGDYKAKPGSYWSSVDITSIDANCKVYEIPIGLRYDFKVGEKLNMFAAAGLSSYIMKKEEYNIFYDRYGTQHQAESYYQGNKSLLSVLRLSAGVEKRVGKQFSIFLSPGVAIPLAGVGEGDVKLYSTDLMLGVKFTPARKK